MKSKSPQRLEVTTQDGVQISLRHTKTGDSRVVIIGPGFFQSKETRTSRNLENDLLKHFDVISMDFRGHGKSGSLYTFSAKEKEDLKAVIDYAREHHTQVGVIGFSYGAAIAILEQAQHQNLESLICVGAPMAPSEIELHWWKIEAWKSALRGCEWGAGVRPGNPFLKKENALDVVDKLKSTPILFLHGSKDPTVGLRHSQRLYDKAQEPKALKIIQGAGHAQDMYRTHRAEFLGVVLDWFEKTLQGRI